MTNCTVLVLCIGISLYINSIAIFIQTTTSTIFLLIIFFSSSSQGPAGLNGGAETTSGG